MATPRDLRIPPISEALVDIRATAPASAERFEALAKELAEDYPKAQVRRGLKAELTVEAGKLLPPSTEDLGFQGIRATNAAGTMMVQFRPDGFTFNNLKVYMGGDALLGTALNLWGHFVGLVEPPVVHRLALRYINRMALPLRPGDDLEKYLEASPVTPPGAPQQVSEFLSRLVCHEGAASVVITQRLKAGTVEDARTDVVIDIDAFRVGPWAPTVTELRPVLDQLRDLKNRTFFSLLTEDAVALFK